MSRKTALKYLIIFFVVMLFALGSAWQTYESKKQIDEIEDTSSLISFPEQSSVDTEETSLVVKSETDLKSEVNSSVNGTAMVTLQDGIYRNFIDVSLDDPGSDTYYEAWLFKNVPKTEYYSLGKLTRDNDTYKMTYFTELDRSDYEGILISEQPSSEPSGVKPGKVVLRGTFK